MPIQRWSERIWLVELVTEPTLDEELAALRQALSAASRTPDLILDLSHIETINSQQLSQILRVRRLVVEAGGRMRLVAPPDRVWAVFLTTGLDKAFEFSRDTASALADLQLDKR